MTTRSLVCEGACNPLVGVVDAAVSRFRKTAVGALRSPGGWGTPVPKVPTNIQKELRALKHTEHKALPMDVWQCLTCETERIA